MIRNYEGKKLSVYNVVKSVTLLEKL